MELMLFLGLAIANAPDAGHLSTFVRALQAAPALDVRYTVNSVGGSSSDFRVVLLRPNKAVFDTQTVSIYADGENVTTFDKSSNTYTVKKQTAQSIAGLLSTDHASLWRGYFDPNVFDAVVSTKQDGTRARQGETLSTISAQLDAQGRSSVRLHLSQKDGIVRQAELTTTVGLAPTTNILSVSSVSTAVPPDSTFVFTPKAGSKLVTERDMRIAAYRKMLEVSKINGVDDKRLNTPGMRGAKCTYTPIQASNSHLIDTYTELFLDEFAKYPIEFVKATRLKQIVLVEQLAVDGQFRAALPQSDTETLYYDVTYMRQPRYCRVVVHHEYFHMIDGEWNDTSFISRTNWSSFNEPGFKYGPGGKYAYGKGDVSSFVHPQKGFLNIYSTYGIEEDKACIWSTMMFADDYKLAKPLFLSDPILMSKLKALQGLAQAKCAEMDREYWKSILGEYLP